MRYKVIRYFTDLQDNDFAYHVGDSFPREGKDVSPSRIAELAGSDNKRGVPLIELVEESTQPVAAESEKITEEKAEVVAEEKPKATRGRKPKK